MPLSARARIELYLPDRPEPVYQDLLQAIVNEFTNAFGGCTISSTDGSFLSETGDTIAEKVFVVYTDTEFNLEDNLNALSAYADGLRRDVFEALDEEEILVVIYSVHHSVQD